MGVLEAIGDPHGLALFAASLLAAGLIAGFIAGLVGVGGGIVLVPVLYHVFTVLVIDPSVRIHLAVGTSLATIVPTSIRSIASHHEKGAVDVALLKQWCIPVVCGVIAGSVLAGVVSGGALEIVFACAALAVAALMAVMPPGWKISNDLPGGLARPGIPAAIGAVAAMMGIGGGTFAVPLMTICGRPIHQAVGTSAGLGLIVSVPATIGFILSGWDVPGRPVFSLGYVSLIGAALIVPATMITVPLGARVAHGLSRRTLTRTFALFLFSTAILMLVP